jgi:hypothetical protein
MRKQLMTAQFFCASNRTPAKVFGVLLAVLIPLGACRTAAESPIAESPECDYRGASGICVSIEEGAYPVNPAALEAAYLRAKRDIETTYHLDLTGVTGPVVHVMKVPEFAQLHPINTRLDGDTGGHHGWTSFDSGEIMITGPAVMRHESIHYLLWKAGYPNRLNAVHDHPAFDEYRDGSWLPKRAATPAPAPVAHNSKADPS